MYCEVLFVQNLESVRQKSIRVILSQRNWLQKNRGTDRRTDDVINLGHPAFSCGA